MPEEEVTPRASSLIMSMRSLGYSFNNSIADILDNSISAEASQIEINCVWEGVDPIIEIKDNGKGMSLDELREAMRPGTHSPLEKRSGEDLGRFGLGLKTASFSQCKRLVVKTTKKGETFCAIWDLDKVEKENKWLLDISKCENSDDCEGTTVRWENIDTLIKKDRQNGKETFENIIYNLTNHVGITFQRYINGDRKKIRFFVNNIECDAYDPFFKSKSTSSPQEYIKDKNLSCLVESFTLPSKEKCTEEEWNLYAGKEGYLANQGFYLYRNGRLISEPTWFGLEKKTPKRKLCRVKIDIDNSNDVIWQLDVKKSKAVPPPFIRKRLRNIIRELVSPAERNFNNRVQRLSNTQILPIWDRKADKEGVFYSVSREHPLIKSFLKNIDHESKQNLENILNLIDSGIGGIAEGIYADFSDDKNINVIDSKDLEKDELEKIILTAKSFIKELTINDKVTLIQAKETIQKLSPFKESWPLIKDLI